MKYIDQTQSIEINKYPKEIQKCLKRLEELDGVETEEYFDLSDSLEKFLEPYVKTRAVSVNDAKKMVTRYSYTLDQIERIKGIRLF